MRFLETPATFVADLSACRNRSLAPWTCRDFPAIFDDFFIQVTCTAELACELDRIRLAAS